MIVSSIISNSMFGLSNTDTSILMGDKIGKPTKIKGISPVHLLSAAFMSAPASLAIAKILVPELERKTKESSESKMAKFKG